jgi:RNA polymerase sigma-70 factor (ECF subfamily)
MNGSDLDQRLSRIHTQWSILLQAEGAPADAVSASQRQLLLRYYGAVYRYLLGMVREPDAAEELTQEFAVRFLRGDFRQADPGRGRFRDFLKTAVRHLAIDYWRRQAKAPESLPPEGTRPAGGAAPQADDLDRPFLDNWREELLARAWKALARVQAETGQPYHEVLRRKAERPEARSAQIAEDLSAALGKAYSVEALRQLLHRARQRFADLLVVEVANSLQTADEAQLEQEVIELGLLEYCRAALARYR